VHVWRVWAGGAGGRAAAHTHTGVTHCAPPPAHVTVPHTVPHTLNA
jgi:hypothetical protein